MQIDYNNIELLDLTALLIDTNKSFTNALKAKRPHTDLVEIYSQIKDIYLQISLLKNSE